MSINHIIKNRQVWLMAFSCVLVAVIRATIIGWSKLYLSDVKGVLIPATSSLPPYIGVLLGTLITGWLSDRYTYFMRWRFNAIFILITTFLMLALVLLPAVMIPFCYGYLVFGTCLFTYGSQVLILLTAIETPNSSISGTTMGLIMALALVSNAGSELIIGYTIQHIGWNWFFISLTICASLACAILWHYPPRLEKAKTD